MKAPILPGETLGILGGGQLGRMLAQVARRWGYRVEVFDPDANCPAGAVADRVEAAPFSDLDVVARFAGRCAVVTLEFENVPVAAADAVADHAPLRPGPAVLATAQHRAREKRFLRQLGLPTARFGGAQTIEELAEALEVTGFPAILKTAAWGYDGKGQCRVANWEEARRAWQTLGEQPLVVEQLVDLAGEISVVAARSLDGNWVAYEPIQNSHVRHILDVSLCPAAIAPEMASQAREMAHAILDSLDVVGVMCVEFFVTTGGQLLVNELAPRPHNSGHLTIDAHGTSQFEQQLRAVCGWPLGSVEQRSPAAMVNLLGEIWSGGEPNWGAALADPRVHLHLYGKSTPREGRKMGHLTALAPTIEEAEQAALAARDHLRDVHWNSGSNLPRNWRTSGSADKGRPVTNSTNSLAE